MYDTGLMNELQKNWANYIYEQGILYLKALKSNRESVL